MPRYLTCCVKSKTIILLLLFFNFLGQYSGEKEPDSSSGTEHGSSFDTTSLEAVGETDLIRKSLMRDELLINAQKFTSQVG